jgi:dTMP kinase|tara:strand:- start:88 stop:705 length:618 start_codon:yes stop_codon:yes gene_type:complete
MNKGKFITIDGIEGAGKSTQIAFICDYLQRKGLDVVKTREPGGTELGEKIRKLLLGRDTGDMHSDTELLLMFSDRNEHIQRKIKPALNAGKWVVSDRFTDASFAYQGGGRELDIERISELESWVHGEFQPDLTIILDIETDLGMRRIEARVEKDRIEQEDWDFFERVRKAFVDRAKKYPERIKLIDATCSVEEVQQKIKSLLEAL